MFAFHAEWCPVLSLQWANICCLALSGVKLCGVVNCWFETSSQICSKSHTNTTTRSYTFYFSWQLQLSTMWMCDFRLRMDNLLRWDQRWISGFSQSSLHFKIIQHRCINRETWRRRLLFALANLNLKLQCLRTRFYIIMLLRKLYL